MVTTETMVQVGPFREGTASTRHYTPGTSGGSLFVFFKLKQYIQNFCTFSIADGDARIMAWQHHGLGRATGT